MSTAWGFVVDTAPGLFVLVFVALMECERAWRRRNANQLRKAER